MSQDTIAYGAVIGFILVVWMAIKIAKRIAHPWNQMADDARAKLDGWVEAKADGVEARYQAKSTEEKIKSLKRGKFYSAVCGTVGFCASFIFGGPAPIFVGAAAAKSVKTTWRECDAEIDRLESEKRPS